MIRAVPSWKAKQLADVRMLGAQARDALPAAGPDRVRLHGLTERPFRS